MRWLRKGQITIVMVMVVLLLIIFGVMFTIQRTTQEKRSEQQRQAVQLSQEKLDPLNEFVTSCLDISAKDGLNKMGMQGGYLYRSQGGPIPDFTQLEFKTKYITYDTNIVAYAIIPPKGSIGPYESEPPTYPWDLFPEKHNLSVRVPSSPSVPQEQTLNDTLRSLLGQANQSTNSTNQSGEGAPSPAENATVPTEENETTLLNATVLTGYFGRNILPNLQKPFTNSMQGQLESFVARNSADCLDLSRFTDQSLDIEKGDPNVTVTLAEDQVIFDLYYPLKITENITGAVGELDHFAVRYDVRLKKIIAFMEQTTNKDVSDLDFNLSNVTGIVSGWVEPSVVDDDDIVFIRDQESRILGSPYTFIYARQNRRPALGLINSTKNRQVYDIDKFILCGVFASDSLKGPVVSIDDSTLVLENQHSDCTYPTTRIPLQVWDPDEDDITFQIEVNGERYDSYRLQEREIGVPFHFKVVARDDALEDWEDLTMQTEVITPR